LNLDGMFFFSQISVNFIDIDTALSNSSGIREKNNLPKSLSHNCLILFIYFFYEIVFTLIE